MRGVKRAYQALLLAAVAFICWSDLFRSDDCDDPSPDIGQEEDKAKEVRVIAVKNPRMVAWRRKFKTLVFSPYSLAVKFPAGITAYFLDTIERCYGAFDRLENYSNCSLKP